MLERDANWGLPEFRFMLAQISFLYFAQHLLLAPMLTLSRNTTYADTEPASSAKKQRTVATLVATQAERV